MVWTVFFMFKLLRLLLVCGILLGAVRFGAVLQDRQMLSEDIIRLHVVGASDSDRDQKLKLQVKDAVVEYLQDAVGKFSTAEEAKAFLLGELENIRNIAQEVVTAAGLTDEVSIGLTRETFDTREYDTFSLPAGVYDSLRIVIGQGEGKNWWCVVFPGLCGPSSSEGFREVSAVSGFSQVMSETLSNDGEYEVRFWLLDFLGRVQNWLFQ